MWLTRFSTNYFSCRHKYLELAVCVTSHTTLQCHLVALPCRRRAEKFPLCTRLLVRQRGVLQVVLGAVPGPSLVTQTNPALTPPPHDRSGTAPWRGGGASPPSAAPRAPPSPSPPRPRLTTAWQPPRGRPALLAGLRRLDSTTAVFQL